MINNDILRRISTIFELTAEQICTIFALSERKVSDEQLENYFKEKDDSNYQEITDAALADFLNGLIIDKRGPSDGPARPQEEQLTNNMIFNKIKIALSLKADDVIAIMELAELSLGKYELSAFFRKVNHKHYKECSDEVLSAFLKGLKIQTQ
jgi:uncharacterized protein YehS (DUF1456 family)